MNRHAFPGVRLAIAGIFVFSAGMACAAPVDRDQLERELRAAQAIEKQSPGKAEALLVDEALAALAAVDAPNAPDGAPAQSGGIPEAEPNNSAATATALSGNLPFPVGSGSITAGDVDYWTFTAPAGARVWIETDTGGTQVAGSTSRDTIIELIAPDGSTVIESDDDDGTANGGDGTVEAGLSSLIGGRVLLAGTYYVRVHAFNEAGIVNPYRLSIVVTTAAPIAESEPNNTAATAGVIAFGTSYGVRSGAINVAGDADYYSMAAAGGTVVYFVADADPGHAGDGTDLVLELRDASDAIVLSVDSSITGSATNPAAEGARYIVPTTGVYYVKVRHYTANGTGDYVLMVSISDDRIFASGFD